MTRTFADIAAEEAAARQVRVDAFRRRIAAKIVADRRAKGK